MEIFADLAEKIKYSYFSVVAHRGFRHSGKGIRPNQCGFPMNCQAKIAVSYNR